MDLPVTLDLAGAPGDLGEPVTIYRQESRTRIPFAIRLLVWLALVTGLGIGCYFIYGDIGPERLREDAWKYLLVLASIVGLVGWMSIPVVGYLYNYLLEWDDIAVEYTKGIAYYHGGVWRSLRWEEIGEVKQWSGSWAWEGWPFIFVDLWPMLAIRGLLAGHIGGYTIVDSAQNMIRVGGTLSSIDEFVCKVKGKRAKSRSTAPSLGGPAAAQAMEQADMKPLAGAPRERRHRRSRKGRH